VTAFLDNAGAMIDFLEANSEVKFNFGKNYPDYHPDHPAAPRKAGRSTPSPLTDENSELISPRSPADAGIDVHGHGPEQRT
jgi:hypothetical protein